MSKLLIFQNAFCLMVAKLIEKAFALGYQLRFNRPQITFGDAKDSCHEIRLAIDLNLFKDGVWLKNTDNHKELGEYWESIGGAWGGRYGDGNHYSLKYMDRE
jgi:hypothetical protein